MESLLLFNEYDLYSVLENQKGKISEVVSKVPTEKILENDENLISEVLNEIKVESISLLEDKIGVDQTEAKVDISWDRNRFILDRSRPSYVDGIKVTYFVPFTGDSTLFKCRPNQFTYNPPHATRINNNEIIYEYNVTDGNVLGTKSAFTRDLENLKQWIVWVNNQVEQFNKEIIEPIRAKIASRQTTITDGRQQINELGFNVRKKELTNSEKETLPAVEAKRTVTKTSRKEESINEVEFDVALSFAGEDRQYVEQVAHILRENGINVFYDNFNQAALWGRNLIDHLGKVYAERSRFIVMFISKHYAEKQWTNYERKSAQDRAFKMQEDCILPARFDDTEILGLPSSICKSPVIDTNLDYSFQVEFL